MSGRVVEALGSGRDELVVVAMDAVAQAPAGGSVGIADRSHDLADLAPAAEQVALVGHPAPDVAGSPWNWNGPGLMVGRSVHATGDSAATMSRRFTRQGVPSMTSRQPSQRGATLSLTIVRISMPMISIATDGSRGADRWVVPPRGLGDPPAVL